MLSTQNLRVSIRLLSQRYSVPFLLHEEMRFKPNSENKQKLFVLKRFKDN